MKKECVFDRSTIESHICFVTSIGLKYNKRLIWTQKFHNFHDMKKIDFWYE